MRLLATTIIIISTALIVFILLCNIVVVVDAIHAPSRCKRILEAAYDSKPCDSSACLNTAERTLCSFRGQCIAGGACTDCSWTAQGYSASSDCAWSSAFANAPQSLSEQVKQLNKQLRLPVLVRRPNRYLPETMEKVDECIEEEVIRSGASGVENFVAPTQMLFLDEPNSSYAGIKIGVGSPILGYMPNLAYPSVYDRSFTPQFNYYMAPLPFSTSPTDVATTNQTIQYADMDQPDIEVSMQFTLRKGELETYMIDQDAAVSATDSAFTIPNKDLNPWDGTFSPFIKQGAFFRSIRSDEMTRNISTRASSIPTNRSGGAGVLFNLRPTFNSFLASAKIFTAPTGSKHSVGNMDLASSAPPHSQYLLPGIMRFKLTFESSNYYVPLLTWRSQTWIAGESPLLIYTGLEASPPPYGSTQTRTFKITNTLWPIAPVDASDVNNTYQSLDQSDIESLFDYESQVINVSQCGNVATLIWLRNGSMRVIYTRDAKTHEYLASQTRRDMFKQLFLVNGTHNASHVTMRCASQGDEYVLYSPGNLTFWAFGKNWNNRFAWWDYGEVNNTYEGKEILLAQRVPVTGDPIIGVDGQPYKPWVNYLTAEVNDTIKQMALGDDFMLVLTTGGNVYFSGNSGVDASRFAACKVENAPKLTWTPGLDNVIEMHTGTHFSVFLRSRTPFLVGCGMEGTITPPFGNIDPFMTPFRFPAIRSSTPVQVCAGTTYACVRAQNGAITCWGKSEADEKLRICGGSSSPAYSTEIQPFVTGEDVSCGDQHVVVRRFRGTNGYDGSQISSYGVCGASAYLGGGYQLSSVSPDVSARPIFAGPNTVFNARTADSIGAANNGITLPPVYDVVQMLAHRKFTLAVTEPRRHSNIDFMLRNWVINAGRPPPTGWHYFATTFAEGDVGPFWVDFTTMPGVPLVTISNQSATDSPWTYMPTDSSTDVPKYRPDINESAYEYLHPTNKWVYFKNWTKMLINTSTAEQFGSSAGFVSTDITLNIPHLVVTTSKGEVFRLGVDAIPCAGEPGYLSNSTILYNQVKAWCDRTNMNRCIWKTAAAASGSYTSALSVSDCKWISLGIRLRLTTFKRVLPVRNGFFLNTSLFLESQPMVTEFLNKFHELRWQNPPCTTIGGPTDCGGAVFYEAYQLRQQKQLVTRTTLFSFPVGGVQLEVVNVTQEYAHALEMKPIDYIDETQVGKGYRGLKGSSQDFLGLTNICFFAKIGIKYYWIILDDTGLWRFCKDPSTYGSGGTVPGGTPIYSLDPKQYWYVEAPNVLRLKHVDRFYAFNWVDKDAPGGYEINDIKFAMSCSGGILANLTVGANGTKTLESVNYQAFILLTNESIDELFEQDPLWYMKDINTTTGAQSVLLKQRLHGAYGCDGGLVVPIQPMVEATAFHTAVQTEFATNATDEIVISIMSPSFSSLHVKYFFVIGSNGPRIEKISDTTTWIGARTSTGRVNATFCDYIPLRTWPNHWNEFALIHNTTTGLTEMWWDGQLACKPGAWFGLGAGQALTVSGLYVGIRNPEVRFSAVARFRELVLCDERTLMHKLWGCTVNGVPLAPAAPTMSMSLTESSSHEITLSKSLITDESVSLSQSITGSESSTHEISLSESLSQSVSFTRSESATSSFSHEETNTTSFSHSESFSHIHIHRLHLLEFNDDLVTSNLIRRTGLLLTFYLQGDLWSPYADWKGKPSGYLLFQTNLKEIDNANALGYSYLIHGTIQARVDPKNWSLLDIQIGPSENINSGRDEEIVFRPRESGVASHILPPNNISLYITGAGFFVSTSDKIVEIIAAAAVAFNVAMLGPSSLVLRMASNMVLTNFQCYNNEYYPRTWLFDPLRLRLGGSHNIGLCVGNLCIILGIMVLWWVMMYTFKKIHKKGGWHKCYGIFGYPSLPLLISLLFVPGLLFGAWRTAFEGDSAKWFFLPLSVVILVFIPLIYLYSKIMDDANFLARWEGRDEAVMQIRKKKYPIWSQFQIPGAWIATDNYGEFVNMQQYFFRECSENRRYWVLYEIVVLLMESFLCSITNDKYSFCTIQMLVVGLMRFVLFGAALRLRPRSAPAPHWICVTIYGGQAAMAIVCAGYAAQRLSNTLRAFVGFMLVGSSFTVAGLSILCGIGAAHERYLESTFYRVLKRESDMTERAPKYKERVVDDIILQTEGEDDDENNDGDESSSGTGVGAYNAAASLMGTSKEDPSVPTIVDNANYRAAGDETELRDISEIKRINDADSTTGAAAADAELVNDDGTENKDDDNVWETDSITGERKRRALPLDMDPALIARKQAEEAALKKRQSARNVWKLIAEEEASDLPTKVFTEYDDL